MSELCQKCGAALIPDDIAFYKKLVNRGATEFWCIPCTASHFGITLDRAEELIAHFRRSGCQLFGIK